MTNYENGANFERRIKKMYESIGWVCIRSAGSRGPIDLICFKGDLEIIFQMKTYAKWKERKDSLIQLAKTHNKTAYYCWREDKAPYKIKTEVLNERLN